MRPPRPSSHHLARFVALVGLLAAAAYLGWRTIWSWGSGVWWLGAPTLAVELLAFAGAALLTWALWPRPVADAPAAEGLEGDLDHIGGDGSIAAVVRVDGQAAHEVRATVLALRANRAVANITIVQIASDPAGTAGAAALAAALGAEFLCAEAHDLSALVVSDSTPGILLLDAGDIPAPDLVRRLAPWCEDPTVAVVQGQGMSFADDSPEHGPNQRHELLFERAGLNSALGRRGMAMWAGSGSLLRRAAVAPVVAAEPSRTRAAAVPVSAMEAHWTASVALFAAGWKVVAPPPTVFAQRSLPDEAAVSADRTHRARAARRLLAAPAGALRRQGLRPAHRLAVAAWTVRPLSGLRRIAFIGLVCAAVLSGAMPFVASPAVVFGLWLPGFTYISLGLAMLSQWTLRPGDRARWSLHTIGPAWSSLRSGAFPATRPVLTSGRAPYAAGVSIAVVALSVVFGMRGLSDRVTHTLGVLPRAHLMALVAVGLWTLALALDVLRVLVRGSRLRRSPRVGAALSGALGEHGVSITDLTPLGAGAVSRRALAVGERLVLDTSIPSGTGVTAARLACVVRNSVPLGDGSWRVGVEFESVEGAAADALAEYCSIEPMWERMGTQAGARTGAGTGAGLVAHTPLVVLPDVAQPAVGRLALRAVSMVAVVGAVGSALPATVEAAPVRMHRFAGVVVEAPSADGAAVDVGEPPVATEVEELVDSDEPVATTEPPVVASETPVGVPGAVVWAVCSLDAGDDGAWGTADDTYGAPVSVVTDADGTYELDVEGAVCWASVAPPDGFAVPGADDVATAEPPAVVATEEAAEVLVERTERVSAPTADPPAAAGALGDLVWHDLDGDGRQSAGEPGVPGVEVTLLAAGGRVAGRTVTDVAGHFGFTGLRPGSYAVSVTALPAGMAFAPKGAGTNSDVDSDVDAVTGRSEDRTLDGTTTFDGLDIGLLTGATAPASAPAGASVDDPAPAAATAPGVAARVLPEPTGVGGPTDDPLGALAVMVLVLAGLLAVGIVLGAGQVSSRPKPASSALSGLSVSPSADLAIK